MTRAQKRAMRELWPLHGLDWEHDVVLDLGPGPLHLEIGFGKGEHLVALAEANPRDGFVGIEVHRPGIAATLQKIAETDLKNIRLIRGDARLALTDHLEGPLFSSVYLLFPDPWPKPGDTRRRILQGEFLDLLTERMIPAGTLHLATDDPTYAGHVDDVMAGRPAWKKITSPPRALVTRYENKGLLEGRSIQNWSFQCPVV